MSMFRTVPPSTDLNSLQHTAYLSEQYLDEQLMRHPPVWNPTAEPEAAPVPPPKPAPPPPLPPQPIRPPQEVVVTAPNPPDPLRRACMAYQLIKAVLEEVLDRKAVKISMKDTKAARVQAERLKALVRVSRGRVYEELPLQKESTA